MHNFGRGMWRRVGDYEKQQQQQQQQNTNSRLAQYLEYLQMQKQRAIDAYYGLKKKEETSDKPKDEVAIVETINESEDAIRQATIVETINESEDAIRQATIVETISETEDAVTIVEPISETEDTVTIVEPISEPEPESEEVICEATEPQTELELEIEAEAEAEAKPLINDITIVDLIGEEELLITQQEVVASGIPAVEPKPSKKRGRKNSGKV